MIVKCAISFQGKLNNTLVVAVKIHKGDKMQKAAFRKEAEIMKTLNHKNILKIYGVCTTKPFSIVMEFMENGSLLNLLRDDEKQDSLRQPEMSNMASQVCNRCSLEVI